MADEGFTWGQALVIAVAGGAVGSALSPIITWVQAHRAHTRTRNEQAALLGTQLAAILEKFAAETAELVGETSAWLQNHHAGDYNLDLPKLDAFPNDAEWNALPKELFSRVFDFQNQRGHTQGSVHSSYASDPELSAEDFCRQGSKCALIALGLAKDLRAGVGLPPRDASKDVWDFEETLRSAADKKADQGLAISLE
jgi:hypothetical protein